MLQKLCGQIERVTYVNEENGYTVAKLKVTGERDLVTVVGTVSHINAGEVLEITGEWAHHPKFGPQFKIAEHRVTLPSSVYGIQKYLGSGLIKGIGPVMGTRLVNKFRERTLEIIDKCPERLKEVDGIGAKRLSMIQEAWESQRKIRDVMVFLQGHGISSGYATKIYKHYGKNSITIVQENPYRLAKDIQGIGFITADKIATHLGIPKDSIIRSEAGIMYVLHQMADEGHVFYPYTDLIRKCHEILDVDQEVILKGFANAVTEEHIVIEDLNDEGGEFIENNKAVYLKGNYIAEVGIAKKLKAIYNAPSHIRSFDISKAIEWVQKRIKIKLADNQVEAIKTAFQGKVMVLTGGPGTGKTTIIRSILEIFKCLHARILLGAPTGRAAKRMSEATGYEAKTIHRLLEYGFHDGWKFKRDQNNPLKAEVIIIDEISMMDNLLMYYLLKAVTVETILILVGDSYQLPSVGAGNVLKDIIESKEIPIVELNEIFRQAAGSLIITNAHRIKNGRFPEIKKIQSDRLGDFYFIERESPEEVAATIIELTVKRIPHTFSFDPLRSIQIITPMNKGIIGTAHLNSALQQQLNSSVKEVRRGLYTYKIGDKVMQTSNNYEKDIFNGDIGYITKINLIEHTVIIDFDGREVMYDFTDLDELVLAYAISIHKSQGSEYPAVIIPIHTQHYILLQRNLIYTAITRGKNLVILVGTLKALRIGINNDKNKLRYTRLRKRLV
ncbi:MAG: ATP-dependent RecD-like DNA helicase [bacterium]